MIYLPIISTINSFEPDILCNEEVNEWMNEKNVGIGNSLPV